MNTIQINNVLTQIDVSKYVKGALSEQPTEQKENVEIQTQLPSKGTKQYDELKATLSNIKVPLTDENLKAANIMIKSGIEVQKENMETVAEIRKQVDYIINHINDNSVESAKNNNLSLDKITLNILENLIKETNLTEARFKTITKSEIKQNVDTYLKENKIDNKDNKSDDLSKYVEKLLYNGLPITYKNISQMESALEKGKQLSDISIDDIINLLKKDKDTTIDEIYISKYSSNKKDKVVKSFVNEKEFEALIPQIKNIVNNKDIDKALKASKILLENEIPVTYENISKLITTDSLKNTGIDEDKLLEKAAQNIKDNKLVTDINLTEIVKSNTELSLKALKSQSKTSELNDSKIQHIDYDNEKRQYKQLIRDIPKYDDEVIKKVLESNNIITLKNLDLAYNETSKKETISELTDEQKGNLQSNLQKELDIITVKRQLAEIQLRLTSEASSLLIKKGIEIDTMPLKDAISELKKVENELYKSQLNLVGTQPTEDNIGQMKDLFDRLSNITELSTKTYKDIVHNEIPFTINGISDAEEINSKAESLQLQEASKTYESLQTQPNPKFNESFIKIANQIKPILEDLNIEPTDDNIRAAEILIKNQIELTDDNISDIKLVDSKVNKVTTQLHPIIAANMIKDGLKPAEMKIDEVIDYMNKFKELLGEDLTQKISSYIYEMDKTGDMTKDERETMIGIYRMLYTIDKTKGRATGFIVKNEMDLTLNNLMEASKYYDKTYAKYSDIDVKVDNKFGTLEKLIIDNKSIKAQLNKAYTSENQSNVNIANETNEIEKVPITENKNLTRSNQNSIEKLIQKLTPETLVKISKDYRDFENIQISKVLDFINKPENLNKENNKPLSEMNINQVIEFINTYEGLSLKTKDNILKIHNAIKTSTINFENLDNIINTKKELTFNDIITFASKFNQDLSTDDNNTKTLNEFIKKVTPQNIEKLILKFKDISSVDIKTLLDNINNSAENKNNISEKPIIQMNIDQISNYVDNSKNLNYQNKDMLLDLYNSFNTIYNNENKVLSNLINSAEEVTINTLRESVNNFKTQNEALRNEISNLTHHITPAIASEIAEANSNISNIPIKQLGNLVSELQNSNELRNTPKSEILTTPLTSLSFDEVIESAKTLQLDEQTKDSILKLYDNLKTLDFNSDYINEFELQPETETLNSVLENLKSNTHNRVTELINNITPAIASKIVETKPNITNIPIKQLGNLVSELQNSSELRNIPKSEILTTPLTSLSFDEVIESAKTLQLDEQTKDSILKLYDNLKTLNFNSDYINEFELQPETETLNSVLENLKSNTHNRVTELINNITPAIASKVVEANPNINNIPIKQLGNLVSELQNSSELRNIPKSEILTTPLTSLSFNEVIESAKTLQLDEQTKDSILKLYDNLKTLDFNSNYINEFELQPETETLNSVLENLKSNTHNRVTELINNITPAIASKVVEANPNINNIPIKQLADLVSELQHSNELRNIPKSETLTTPLTSLSFDEVIESAKALQLNEESTNTILKLYTVFEDIKTFKSNTQIENLSINDLINSYSQVKDNQINIRNILEELEQKVTPEAIIKLNKKYTDIDSTPLKTLLDDINIIGNSNNQRLSITKLNNKLKISSMTIEDVINCVNTNYLIDNKSKDSILKIHSIINSLNSEKYNLLKSISDADNVTLNNVLESINQQESLKISNTIQTLENKFKLSEIQTQAENLINEFSNINTQTVSTLLEAYPNLNEMSVNKVLNLIKNNNKNVRLSGIAKNSDFNNELPNIEHILDTLNNLKSNKIDKHQLTENLIKYTDEIDQKIEFSLESLIEETDNLMNTNLEINADSKLNTVFYNNTETPNVLNKSIDLKQNIIDEFIEKANPEIIAKLINQSYDIENLPLERILESIDSIQKFNNPKEYNNKDLNKENKEFIQRLSKLSNVEPATILWMKNNNIPLSVQNIEIIHNFVNNPFWFGQQINNLSKEFKSKLSNDKTLEKVINKKNFNDLQKEKSFDDILNELEDEIHEIKKDIIQLPNQERQNLWKQSSDLEKAIEIQKQIQKDEMIYQIPIQLHSGITNMNLYVMNDKEGNGKLSDDNMKIFLAMNTETLGNVQIYMNFTEKNVSFQINSDTPEATKFLKEQQSSLQMSIEDLGYIVNKMQYGEDKPKSAYKLDIRSQITGINTSKLGFEAIM